MFCLQWLDRLEECRIIFDRNRDRARVNDCMRQEIVQSIWDSTADETRKCTDKTFFLHAFPASRVTGAIPLPKIACTSPRCTTAPQLKSSFTCLIFQKRATTTKWLVRRIYFVSPQSSLGSWQNSTGLTSQGWHQRAADGTIWGFVFAKCLLWIHNQIYCLFFDNNVQSRWSISHFW